ncbi:hypothetical protein NQ317_008145 [Molorchus minor]|uniref:Sister chromatid cohesion protein DCC1 n=1 Tax=Molorchus minor TaxID=1323400 RepID=A0ABQ9JJ22_9CUCU|nr:hypothetical protein NQ317_008145 [Molorchus minor]
MVDKESERSLEEINEILTLAKLNESEIKSTSQAIYFTSKNLYENNYKLLQPDSHLLKELNVGNTLYIKGDDDEEVVICSETQTFHVTCAETSNSLLLVNNLLFDGDIQDGTRTVNKIEVGGVFYEYLEAVVGKPHIRKLNVLLKGSVYKGSEHEFQVDEEKLYTFEQLNNVIQASTKEIKEALSSMNVVTINGKIRLLDFEYHFRVLSYMLKLIDENSWELDEIDYEVTLDTLSDLVPKEILTSLFDKYTEESKIIDGLQLYRYSEFKVCRFFAEVLLSESGKFNLKDFLQAWKESVPEGMNPTEDMLYGVAIIDRKAHPNVIWSFDESGLPDNIIDTF